MRVGPVVGGHYPGTPVMLIVAGFCGFLVGRSILSAYRRKHDAALRQNPGASVWVAIVAAYLLVMALWAIWVHR